MKTQHLATLIVVAALVGAACGAAATTPAPTPPTTTHVPVTTAAAPGATNPAAGQMTFGRSDQTATLLTDGRVLVAGGYRGGIPMVSVDLFDPATDAFAATGPLALARSYHTATRLTDGRVLIVGGTPHDWTFNGPFLASAELYDPKSGTFGPTGSLTTARNLHTATLLLDGRVLVVGGNDSRNHSLASAEVYDPKTGTFSQTGSVVTARGFHTATLLADGRVLITGGTSAGWYPPFLASAEIYDPKTGTFGATKPMSVERGSHTATLLADGHVLITGGTNADNDGKASLASAELYDPKTRKFTPTGSMADGRTFHEATLLADGRVLVTGGGLRGWEYDGPFLASVELFDPKTGTFAETGPMAKARVSQSATLLSDGRVLIAGGYNGIVDLGSAEIYDPQTGTFSPTG